MSLDVDTRYPPSTVHSMGRLSHCDGPTPIALAAETRGTNWVTYFSIGDHEMQRKGSRKKAPNCLAGSEDASREGQAHMGCK
jgi:hypothetical protein